MQRLAGEARGSPLESGNDMRGEIVGVEDGDAGLEGRGDSVFERHDEDGGGERSVRPRTKNKSAD